jgi:hypothetical protein
MKGILINENNDLDIQVKRDEKNMIVRGLVVGDSTLQNQKLLLMCNKGEIKEYPTLGVGITNYLESHDGNELAREIRKQFSADGMRINRINIDIPHLEIDAEYIK